MSEKQRELWKIKTMQTKLRNARKLIGEVLITLERDKQHS